MKERKTARARLPRTSFAERKRIVVVKSAHNLLESCRPSGKVLVQIVKKEAKPGIIVLELSGPLQMGVECKQLELAFDELLRDNHTKVILDLSGLTKLDSGGLGKIVNCFSRLKTAGGSLCLVGTTGVIDGLLKMTHANRFLKCYPTASAAAEDLSGAAGSAYSSI